MSISSPCIGVCELDDETMSYCIGCFRTRDEIARWSRVDETEQMRILEAARQREESGGTDESLDK